MMIFPAYYGDMLTEQMGNLHTKEMEINASFNTLQDNMARINITQDSVLDDLKEIQEKCLGLVNDNTFSDEYSATTKAVTATEEDMESLANAFNPCLANPNTDFDVYEEKLKQVLEYSISMYKNAHDAFTRLEDEKNSLGNKDKDKDKENRRSKRRSDDRKRPLSYNLNNLSKLEDIRNDLQRASASTSKEQESEQSAEECDTIGFMAFVDELKLILNSNPFTRLIPEPEPVVEPEPVKKEEADESNLDELPMEEEDFKDNIANDPFLSGWSGGFPDIKVEDIKNEDFMSFLNNYAENNGDVLVEPKIESSYDLTNNPNYTNEQFIADVNGIFADLEN
ncbi:uncharacterized protein [Atheta coriaria]|uniref:uncharacterized protein n=1 Tax=Dalotia coriaria TaxID=877792 RepID=UPI0031F3F273